MGRDEIQTAVDALAEALQRSVVINDAGVHLLYASAHYGDEDPVRVQAVLQRQADSRAVGHVLAQGVSTWTSAGVIPPNDELQMRARVCVPVRWRGELLGLLMVMDGDGSLTTTELTGITDVAHDLAPVLAARLLDEAGDTVAERTVLDLVSREPMLRRRALAELAPGGEGDRFASVTAVELGVDGAEGAAAPHAETALRNALQMRGPALPGNRLSAVTGGVAVLLLGSATALPEAVARDHAERLVQRVGELSAGRFACVAGVGAPAPGLDRAADSAEQATVARRAAGTVVGGPVALWTALGPYGPVLRIPRSDLTETALPEELRRLQAVDRGEHLAGTLRAYLDSAGNGPVAAEALHVHRTTLYYRLGRITELTGLDLDDGRTRLALHLGLAMLEVMRAGRP